MRPPENPASRPLPRVPETAPGENQDASEHGPLEAVGHLLHNGMPYVTATGAHALRWLSENAQQVEQKTSHKAGEAATKARRRGRPMPQPNPKKQS